MQKLLFTLHLIVGLGAGLLFALLGLTGALLVFREEIEAALRPDLHPAQMAPAGAAAPVSWERVLGAARAAAPDGARVEHLFLPAAPGAPVVAWLAGDQARIYLDPHSARVLGVEDPTRTLTGWLFALHTRLLTGAQSETGEKLVGYGGLLLLAMSVSGIVLWWPRKAAGQRLRAHLTIKRGASAKRVNYDLHRAGGFYLAVPLALLALTGVTLVFDEPVEAGLRRLTGAPPVAPRPKIAATHEQRSPMNLDALVQAADVAVPGGQMRRISLPKKSDAPVLIRKRLPGELHPNGMSRIYLNPCSGAVVRVERADAPLVVPRFMNLRYPLHIGVWGGLASRIAYAFVGLAPTLLLLTGAAMWWVRVGAKRLRATRERRGVLVSARPRPRPG